jgi:hypothetical protein
MGSCDGDTRASSTGLVSVEQHTEQRLQQRLERSKARLSCCKKQKSICLWSQSGKRAAQRTLPGIRSKARPCLTLARPRLPCTAMQTTGHTRATQIRAGCVANTYKGLAGSNSSFKHTAPLVERQDATCHDRIGHTPGNMLNKSKESVCKRHAYDRLTKPTSNGVVLCDVQEVCPVLSWVTESLSIHRQDKTFGSHCGGNLDGPSEAKCLPDLENVTSTRQDTSNAPYAWVPDRLGDDLHPAKCAEECRHGRRTSADRSGLSACKRLQNMLEALS